MAEMTREQFAEAYAARSGTTVAWLEQHGRVAMPCDCGSLWCDGWQMAYAEDFRDKDSDGQDGAKPAEDA